MSDIDEQDGGSLDRSLSSYYGELAAAPVPVKLHGRTVRSLEARGGSRLAWRALRPHRSWAIPTVLAGILVAAVALVGMPWLRGSSGAGGPDASTSADMQVTFMNLGADEITVQIGGKTISQMPCGANATYTLTSYPIDIGATVDGGTYTETVPNRGEAHEWWIYRPTGPNSGWLVTPHPIANYLYAVCPTTSTGTDVGNLTTFNPQLVLTEAYQLPAVSGTGADAKVSQAILAAIDQWGHVLGNDLMALRSAEPTPTGTGSVSVTYETQPLPGWLSIAYTFEPRLDPSPGQAIPHWIGQTTIDTSDGHTVGVDELFTNPTQGLAVLSAQSRQLLGMPPDGGAYADETAPAAANFAMWYPTADGLRFEFEDPAMASWTAPSLYQRELTIPWSAFDGLIKQDSPVRTLAWDLP